MPNKRRTSLENAFEILKLFSINKPEMSVTEVARQLGVSKSTAHRLLSSLLAEEFVYQNPKNQRYSLGSSILSLVQIVNSQIHISSESLPILNAIAEQTRESSHLCIVEDPETVVYIQTVKGAYQEMEKVQLGMRKAISYSACGKIFLAYDQELQKEQNTSLEGLRSIAAEGYSILETNKTTELAVPVFFCNQVTAAISVTANTKRIRSERIKRQIIHYLQHGAKKLESIITNRKKGGASWKHQLAKEHYPL